MNNSLKRKLSVVQIWVEQNSNDLYWFLIFLAMYPALRSDLMFPHTWYVHLTSEYSLPAIENPFGFWILSLAILMAVVTFSSRRWLGVFGIIAFVLISAFGSKFAKDWNGVNTAYAALSFVLFLYFIIIGSVKTLSFLSFVVLLAIMQAIDRLMAWPQILIFVVAALVSSLVVETIRQNIPLTRKLGRNNLLQLSGKTLALWWPMLILIAIGLWLSEQLTKGAEESFYQTEVITPYCKLRVDKPNILACPNGSNQLKAEEITQLRRSSKKSEQPAECMVWKNYNVEVPIEPEPKSFLCPDEIKQGMVWSLDRLTFFESLDLSVERHFDIREWLLKGNINSVKYQLNRKTTNAGQAAKSIFSVVPKTTGMKTSKCDLIALSCHAANIVINGLNAAYIDARAEAKIKFVNKMSGVTVATKKEINQFAKLVDGEAAGILSDFEKITRNSINRVHTATTLLRQVLLLWLILIAIKSFLFVFARVIFDKSTDIDVDLLEHDGATAEGSVKSLQEVNIPGDYPYNIYYKANYQPLGPAPRFSIPQWNSSILSRLRFGAWNMSQVKMPIAEKSGLTFNAIEAEHLVDWDLEEGEEVIFGYRHFVAMNENIQLRTVVSLRVETLLLGRIVFHTARCVGGPGRMILRTRGKPATAKQVQQSIPAARLVAWNRYARFSVDSHLTRTDIFLNGFNLKRSDSNDPEEPQGILVVEADARDGGILVGTLRFAKNFLLPI